MKCTVLSRCLAVAVVLMAVDQGSAEFTKDTLETIEGNLHARRAVLLDVREDVETKKGYVDGAILVPLSLLSEGSETPEFGQVLQQQIPRKAIVYTYCQAGRRAEQAAEILIKFGYDVRPLNYGFEDLAREGFVTARPK